jgi:hypothetical protein
LATLRNILRHFSLADFGKTISAQQDFDGLHIWDKPGLSGPSGLSGSSGWSGSTK